MDEDKLDQLLRGKLKGINVGSRELLEGTVGTLDRRDDVSGLSTQDIWVVCKGARDPWALRLTKSEGEYTFLGSVCSGPCSCFPYSKGFFVERR